MGKSWVGLSTKTEDLTEIELWKAGYRTWRPRYRVMTTRFVGRERKPVGSMLLLLPGVIFTQDWRGFPKQPPITGVVGLLPGSLSAEDICVLQGRERTRVFDEVGTGGIEAILGELSAGGRALLEGLLVPA